MNRSNIFLLSFLAFNLTSCGFSDEPDHWDPKQFFGCYRENGFQISIDRDEVVVDGTSFPSEISRKKIGVVLVLPLVFHTENRRLVAVESGYHYYRFLSNGADKKLIIADQEEIVHELKYGDCHEK